ncbi:MAG: acylphosphatase [bacterium]|nr:acylphosphatase [bacterium]
MTADSEIHIKVEGWVQGVFFRDEAVKFARQYKVTGWIKNLPDGSVEILAQGEKENLEKFLVWARQGPPAAEVDTFDIQWREPTDSFTSFEIKY